jgi:hypothetical protein
MTIRGTLALALLLTRALVAQEPAPVPLPAIPSDPQVARVHDLEQQNIELRTQLLKRDIELSTCRATVDSVTLSDRARELVDEFKRIYGNDWTWSAEQNRPVRAPAQKEPQ